MLNGISAVASDGGVFLQAWDKCAPRGPVNCCRTDLLSMNDGTLLDPVTTLDDGQIRIIFGRKSAPSLGS